MCSRLQWSTNIMFQNGNTSIYKYTAGLFDIIILTGVRHGRTEELMQGIQAEYEM